MPRLRPSFLNRLFLTEVRELEALDTLAAACERITGEDVPEIREETKGVFSWFTEPRATCSGGEGMGMSTRPTSNTHRTSFFLPSALLSSGIGNKNLEVAD